MSQHKHNLVIELVKRKVESCANCQMCWSWSIPLVSFIWLDYSFHPIFCFKFILSSSNIVERILTCLYVLHLLGKYGYVVHGVLVCTVMHFFCNPPIKKEILSVKVHLAEGLLSYQRLQQDESAAASHCSYYS